MQGILVLLGAIVANRFKSRRRLAVEILYLRHLLNIALRDAVPENSIQAGDAMRLILILLGTLVGSHFKSQRRLEVENLFLRHQLNIALRHAPERLQLHGYDRGLLLWMTWLWPSLLDLSGIVQPDTILRWHRAGFRAYWRRKSRGWAGRPRVSLELRELIRRMSKENPLWGAPRIHGELLKLGFAIA